MNKNTVTPEEVAQMIKLYVEKEWSARRIADHMYYSHSTVYRHLHIAGVVRPKKGAHHDKWAKRNS